MKGRSSYLVNLMDCSCWGKIYSQAPDINELFYEVLLSQECSNSFKYHSLLKGRVKRHIVIMFPDSLRTRHGYLGLLSIRAFRLIQELYLFWGQEGRNIGWSSYGACESKTSLVDGGASINMLGLADKSLQVLFERENKVKS